MLSAVDSAQPEYGHNLAEQPLQGTQPDVSAVPDVISSHDPPTQTDVVDGVVRNVAKINATDSSQFLDEEVHDLKVTTLKRMYETKQKRQAISLLHRRNRIVFAKEDTYSAEDPGLRWAQHEHRLDFLLVVPKDPGLDAIIHTDPVNLTYQFELKVKQWLPWKTKHAELGFDSSRKILYIGKVGGQNVWLAYAPLEFFGEDCTASRYDDDADKSPLIMTQYRYRRTVYFLSRVLMNVGVADIRVTDDYPEEIDHREAHVWNASTSFLYVQTHWIDYRRCN